MVVLPSPGMGVPPGQVWPPLSTVHKMTSLSPGQPPYFIAFIDNSVRLADVYWVRDDTLYYVTPDHQMEQTPLNSLDRTLSERLNCEKKLSFYLPAELHPSSTGWRLAPTSR